jgi:hypothetical protein
MHECGQSWLDPSRVELSLIATARFEGFDIFKPIDNVTADLDVGRPRSTPPPSLKGSWRDIPSSREIDLIEVPHGLIGCGGLRYRMRLSSCDIRARQSIFLWLPMAHGVFAQSVVTTTVSVASCAHLRRRTCFNHEGMASGLQGRVEALKGGALAQGNDKYRKKGLSPY